MRKLFSSISVYISIMDKEEHLKHVRYGLNVLHDHFDQIRDKHDLEGNFESRDTAIELQEKIEEVESRVDDREFESALSGVSALRSIAYKLERYDEAFDWNDDPEVDEWEADLKTSLTVLKSIGSDE
jgi:hypothetical protein